MSTGLHRSAIDDAPTTLQDAVGATGNGTALSVKGWDGVAVQVTGTFVATVTFEGTIDGTTWVSLEAYNVATGAVATTSTAAADYLIALSGFEYFRARATWTSGTSVTVKARAFPGAVAASLIGSVTTSGTGSTANQGTGGTSAWAVTDYTNTAGVLTPTADATVAGVSANVLAANASRKAALIQNVGSANIRVGTGVVTATTGLQLTPGATLILRAPFCPVAAITAIRETSTSSTVSVAEVV